MSEIKKRIQRIIDEFNQLSCWEEKYEKIIALGKKLSVLPGTDHRDELKIKGCQSQVWLKAHLQGDRVFFYGDSDALIVKGLLAVLLEIYSGISPKEIVTQPVDFIKELGLDSNLTPTRTGGLYAIIRQIIFYASAFQVVLEKEDKGS